MSPTTKPAEPARTASRRTGSRRGAGRGARLRRTAGPAALLLSASLLAACGGSASASPTLTWYINPDSGGQAEIASRCTQASNGAYRIATSQLPRESSEQRQQLVRRLAAKDSSIDLMSLDPPYIPEFAQAKFLAPVPQDVGQRVTEGVFKVAVTGEHLGRPAGRRAVLGQHPAALVQEVGRAAGRPRPEPAGHLAAAGRGGAEDQEGPRGPGHPRRGAHGLGQRAGRVGRRRGHHRRRGQAAGRQARPGRRAGEAGRGRSSRASSRRGSPGRPSRPPARTPTPTPSRTARRRSWSTGRSSGPRRTSGGRGGHARRATSSRTTAGRSTPRSRPGEQSRPPFGGISPGRRRLQQAQGRSPSRRRSASPARRTSRTTSPPTATRRSEPRSTTTPRSSSSSRWRR